MGRKLTPKRETTRTIRDYPRHRISVAGVVYLTDDEAEADALNASLHAELPRRHSDTIYSNPTTHSGEDILAVHLRKVRGERPPDMPPLNQIEDLL